MTTQTKYRPARYRPAHQPPSDGSIFIMNTGSTRLRDGDWSVQLPDGTRKPWVGRGQQETPGSGQQQTPPEPRSTRA